MTNSKSLFISTLALLGGGYLILSIPAWLSYLTLAAGGLSLIIHTTLVHKPLFKTILHFIIEFFAFAMMLTALIVTAVLTHNVLNVL
ncbi:hypothetical protein OS175_06520 [Marinicella sp. S1101]|uniref:hypothetical protein n=1 Tax=Marinicella marina TaxID=2996016 RepID=UPI002260C101|nr:hypothetical protein [Marinicella marina]MCX7553527.1 hypothetical protein [Marinicella marina]MDJ1140151.1 hypothetical protein [Marinicella marina]